MEKGKEGRRRKREEGRRKGEEGRRIEKDEKIKKEEERTKKREMESREKKKGNCCVEVRLETLQCKCKWRRVLLPKSFCTWPARATNS